jgi:hypothetical protein
MNIKIAIKWAALAGISMTVNAAELWVNDTASGTFTKNGDASAAVDVIYSNGSYSGTYQRLNGTSLYVSNDAANLLTSGTFILLGGYGSIGYRAFDGGDSITLNDLQYHADEGIGDSLSLRFTAASQVTGASRFSFGFLGAGSDPLFVSYFGNIQNSSLRYRTDSRLLGAGQGNTLSGEEALWKDSLFDDLLTHDLDFTVSAIESGYRLTLTISANGDQTPVSITQDLDSTSAWLISQGSVDITGIGFRTESHRFIINDIQVLYTTIPEPSALALLGIGMLALIVLKFRGFMRATSASVFKFWDS